MAQAIRASSYLLAQEFSEEHDLIVPQAADATEVVERPAEKR
ncbi:hypothetical protein [Ktedonosporobacter rubrisoli]|nr:hypothetical protein [Ktedonosporobacter rubrisoli]